MKTRSSLAVTQLARAAILGWLTGVVAALLSGCATSPKESEVQHLAWPPPPQTARIEFVRNYVSDEDLEHDTTFSQRVMNFVRGDKPTVNRIAEPMGLAVSDDGKRLYVSDFGHLAVFVFDFEKNSFAKIGTSERLARPVGLTLDAQENVYVVEQEKKGIGVFDRAGNRLRFITDPSIERPTGIALDRTHGWIYLADTGHSKSKTHTVKVFDLNGKLLRSIGGAKGDKPGHFMFPTYLAVDDAGNLYVTDTLNSRVQKFDPQGKYLQTFGGRGNAWGMFDKPKGVALDQFGNVYVADSGWSNVQIFNQKGQVLLFFGGRGPIPGMLKNPTAVTIDRNNLIYVADYLNHRIGVYRLINTTAADSFLNPPAAESTTTNAVERVASDAGAPAPRQ